MHQSLQKPLTRRRDKYSDLYSDFDLADPQADRRLYRDTPPKARKFQREEFGRDPRWDKQDLGK
jgi:hypothetical protein